ncbi:hypothetical protein R4I06_03825 [Anaplasma bovis]
MSDHKNMGRIDLPQGFVTVYSRGVSLKDILVNRVRVYMKVDRKDLVSNVYVERRIKESIQENRLKIVHNRLEDSFHVCLGSDRLEIKHLYIFTKGQEPSSKDLKVILGSMAPEHALVQMLYEFHEDVHPSAACYSRVSSYVDNECTVELCCNVTLACSAHNLLSCVLMSHPELNARNWKYDMVLQYIEHYFDMRQSMRRGDSKAEREYAKKYVGGLMDDLATHGKELVSLVSNGLLPDEYNNSLTLLTKRKSESSDRSRLQTGVQRNVLLMLYGLYAPGGELFYTPIRSQTDGLVCAYVGESKIRRGITIRALQYVYSAVRENPDISYAEIDENAPYLCAQLPGLIKASYALISACILPRAQVFPGDSLYPLHLVSGYTSKLLEKSECDVYPGVSYAQSMFSHASNITSTDEDKAFAIKVCTTDSVLSRRYINAKSRDKSREELIAYLQQGSSNEKAFSYKLLREFIGDLETTGLEAAVINSFVFEINTELQKAQHCLEVFFSTDIYHSRSTSYLNGILRSAGLYGFAFLNSVVKQRMKFNYVVPQTTSVTFKASEKFKGSNEVAMVPVTSIMPQRESVAAMLRKGIESVQDFFVKPHTGIELSQNESKYDGGNAEAIASSESVIVGTFAVQGAAPGVVSAGDQGLQNDPHIEMGVELSQGGEEVVLVPQTADESSRSAEDSAESANVSANASSARSDTRSDISRSPVVAGTSERRQAVTNDREASPVEFVGSWQPHSGVGCVSLSVERSGNAVKHRAEKNVQNTAKSQQKATVVGAASENAQESNLHTFTVFFSVDGAGIRGLSPKDNHSAAAQFSVKKSDRGDTLHCSIGGNNISIAHKDQKPIALLFSGDRKGIPPNDNMPFSNTLRFVFQSNIPKGVIVADGCSSISVAKKGRRGIAFSYNAVEEVSSSSLFEYAVCLENAHKSKMWWRYDFLTCYLQYHDACKRVQGATSALHHDMNLYRHFFRNILQDKALPATCRSMLSENISLSRKMKDVDARAEGTSLPVIAMLYGFSCTSSTFHTDKYENPRSYKTFNAALMRTFLTNSKFRHAVISSGILHASKASNMGDPREFECSREEIFPIFARRTPYLSDSIHAVIGITKGWNSDPTKDSQHILYPLHSVGAFASSQFIASNAMTLDAEYRELVMNAHMRAKDHPEAFYAFFLSASVLTPRQARSERLGVISDSIGVLKNTVHLDELIRACEDGRHSEVIEQIKQYLSHGVRAYRALISFAVADHIMRFYQADSLGADFMMNESAHEKIFIENFREFVQCERVLIDSGNLVGCVPHSLRRVRDMVPENYSGVYASCSEKRNETLIKSVVGTGQSSIDR